MELGEIRIANEELERTEFADYSVQFGVKKVAAVAAFQRAILNYPRRKYNVLGLVRMALLTLDEREFTFDEEMTDDNLADKTSNRTMKLGRGRGFLGG